jgi:hypothetical protein
MIKRKFRSSAFWKGHVDKWKNSDLTQAEYCRQTELNPKLFWLWKKKFIGKSQDSKNKRIKTQSTKFVEVDIKEISSNKNCLIELENSIGEQFKIYVNHKSALEYVDFIKSFLSKK